MMLLAEITWPMVGMAAVIAAGIVAIFYVIFNYS